MADASVASLLMVANGTIFNEESSLSIDTLSNVFTARQSWILLNVKLKN